MHNWMMISDSCRHEHWYSRQTFGLVTSLEYVPHSWRRDFDILRLRSLGEADHTSYWHLQRGRQKYSNFSCKFQKSTYTSYVINGNIAILPKLNVIGYAEAILSSSVQTRFLTWESKDDFMSRESLWIILSSHVQRASTWPEQIYQDLVFRSRGCQFSRWSVHSLMLSLLVFFPCSSTHNCMKLVGISPSCCSFVLLITQM